MTKKTPTEYRSLSLDASRIENLKNTLEEHGIGFRSDADAIYKAIDKYIFDLKLIPIQIQKKPEATI